MITSSQSEDIPGATNVWTNPNAEAETNGNGVSSKLQGSIMPQKVLKELDKRIVGSFNNIAEAYKDKSHHRRHNSWDNGNATTGSPDRNFSPIDVRE